MNWQPNEYTYHIVCRRTREHWNFDNILSVIAFLWGRDLKYYDIYKRGELFEPSMPAELGEIQKQLKVFLEADEIK